jgi:hypothetical protein
MDEISDITQKGGAAANKATDFALAFGGVVAVLLLMLSI